MNMLEKAKYAAPLLAIFAIATGLFYTAVNANEAVEEIWLCSGRFISAESQIEYDYFLTSLTILSSIAISIAYFMIPWFLNSYVSKRDDVSSSLNILIYKFIHFIVLCGLGHLLDAYNIFGHQYYLAAFWHLATAIISLDTVLSIYSSRHIIAKIPSTRELHLYKNIQKITFKNFNCSFWKTTNYFSTIKLRGRISEIMDESLTGEVSMEVFKSFIHPKDYVKFKLFIEKRPTDPLEFRILIKGNVFYFKMFINRDSELNYFYGLLQDITKEVYKKQETAIQLNKFEIRLLKYESADAVAAFLAKFKNNG